MTSHGLFDLLGALAGLGELHVVAFVTGGAAEVDLGPLGVLVGVLRGDKHSCPSLPVELASKLSGELVSSVVLFDRLRALLAPGLVSNLRFLLSKLSAAVPESEIKLNA